MYVALLKGGRGFVESNREVNRENFSEYVKSLELEKNYSGVQGIGFTKIISAEERKDFVEKMKSEGYVEFNIFPAAEKNSYQIVTYLEPFNQSNQKSIGFDMSGESNRSKALDRARDLGDAASSAKVNLIQEKEGFSETGFLIFLPIYKNGKLPLSIEDRKKNIIGYIYSPFRANDFLNEIQNDKSASDIKLKIYDGEVGTENLLAKTADPQKLIDANEIEEKYTAQTNLNVAGRKWIIQYDSAPSFTAQSSLGWIPFIFIIGAILSFLLFGMTYWETSARIKLQTTAAELFELEKQKQGLLEKEQKARLTAEQANNTKDEFIAVVSHELRTPLNSIAGWARILRTEDLSDNTKKLALEKIEKNLRSQTKLVEELLDYSQIVSRTIRFEGNEFNFSDVFENTFSEIQPTAQEKNIEFIKDNQLNGHQILGDEDKIKLVIYNLLTNAVKFTHSGGKVESALMEDNGAIQMIIRDNGKGISQEFLPHIFDRFTQADTSITRSSGGLGLGLTISNHIIKLHNGTIEANSEGIGKGSVFTVKVPLKS
ncbi:MAG: CHASE domain-containing protein [Acidobacteriota bacterium]|nr:CHASE domain-containing protein [Acidobacteriota bacterium]